MKMMMIIIMIIASTHLLCPVAIETAGTWNAIADKLVQEIGRRIIIIIIISLFVADIYNAPITTKQEHRCSTKIHIVVDETY